MQDETKTTTNENEKGNEIIYFKNKIKMWNDENGLVKIGKLQEWHVWIFFFLFFFLFYERTYVDINLIYHKKRNWKMKAIEGGGM